MNQKTVRLVQMDGAFSRNREVIKTAGIRKIYSGFYVVALDSAGVARYAKRNPGGKFLTKPERNF